MTTPSQPDTVTVPRELYDWLVEYAIHLKAEWLWKGVETRHQYASEYSDLSQRVDEAVKIMDEKPEVTQ
jgi:hypothetical protein